MYTMTAEAIGVRRLLIPIPTFIVPVLALLVSLLRTLRIPVPVDAKQVRMSAHKIFYDCSKAWSELGKPEIDIRQTLRDTYEWYRENGYIR